MNLSQGDNISPFSISSIDVEITQAKRLAKFAVDAEEDLEYLEAIRLYSQACSILQEWIVVSQPQLETQGIVTGIVNGYKDRIEKLRMVLPAHCQVQTLKHMATTPFPSKQNAGVPKDEATGTSSQMAPVSTMQTMKNCPGINVAAVREAFRTQGPGEQAKEKYGPVYARMSHFSKIVLSGGFISENVYVQRDVWKQDGVRVTGFVAKLQVAKTLASMRLVHRLEGMGSPAPVLEMQTRLSHIAMDLERVEATLHKAISGQTTKAETGSQSSSNSVKDSTKTRHSQTTNSRNAGGGNLFDSIWKDVKSLGQMAQKSASTAIQRINVAASVVVTNAINLEEYRNAILEVCAQYITYTPMKIEFQEQLKSCEIGQRNKTNLILLKIDKFYSELFYEMVMRDVRQILEHYVTAMQGSFVPYDIDY